MTNNMVTFEETVQPVINFRHAEQGVGLDAMGFATSDSYVTVYNVDPYTLEFTHPSEEHLTTGVGIPAYSYLDTPPLAKSGYAIVRTSKGWEYVVDLRGQLAYDKASGRSALVQKLGELESHLTFLAPNSSLDTFDGTQWVVDEIAQKQQVITQATKERDDRMAVANEQITLLADAIALDLAEQGDKEKYDAWRKYRVLLSRVDLSSAPDITWPELSKD